MNNLLISDKMTQGLFAEPSVAELYRTERSVPNTIIFLQRASTMAQTANPATLRFLGRVLKVSHSTLGYLQILRPTYPVQAQSALAMIKTSCLEASNFFLAHSGTNEKVGAIQVGITEQALRALTHLETYDPVNTHLEAFQTQEGTKIHVSGEGLSMTQLESWHSLIDGDIVEFPSGVILSTEFLDDYELLLTGIRFPIEAING